MQVVGLAERELPSKLGEQPRTRTEAARQLSVGDGLMADVLCPRWVKSGRDASSRLLPLSARS